MKRTSDSNGRWADSSPTGVCVPMPPTAAHPTNPLKSVIVEGSAPVAGRNMWNSGPAGPSNCKPPGMGRGVAEVVLLRPVPLLDPALLRTAERDTPVSNPEPASAPRVKPVFSRNPLRFAHHNEQKLMTLSLDQ